VLSAPRPLGASVLLFETTARTNPLAGSRLIIHALRWAPALVREGVSSF
jgi:hypothetical protein